jgi:hypothetical protein
MKFKTGAIDISFNSENYYDPSSGVSPEKMYGPEWKNAYIVTETYTGFDDSNHYSISNHILVRADIEHTDKAIFDTLVKAAKADAICKNVNILDSWHYETFEEAVFNIDFLILKSYGIIPLVVYEVPTTHLIENYSDYSNTLDLEQDFAF